MVGVFVAFIRVVYGRMIYMSTHDGRADKIVWSYLPSAYV